MTSMITCLPLWLIVLPYEQLHLVSVSGHGDIGEMAIHAVPA
ncbi:MAG: hypothetical protein AAF590_07050 [Pseudomonadota bacterium]